MVTPAPGLLRTLCGHETLPFSGWRNGRLPVIPQAAATHTSQSQAGGLFMLAWGLVAFAFGLAMVTNFRGFAGNFARQVLQSVFHG